MSYAILQRGVSRSFPEGDAFLAKATVGGAADVLVCIGMPPPDEHACKAIAIELDRECLADHVGFDAPPANVFGFARYRNGSDAPSRLVELVRLPNSDPDALAAVRQVFEGAGLAVSVCADHAGRIIDRLVRPKYNAALRLLDEGLATQADMDLTCRLGLGYPDGPIERVMRGGLADHFEVTSALFETFGTSAYAPARQAVIAARRAKAK